MNLIKIFRDCVIKIEIINNKLLDSYNKKITN